MVVEEFKIGETQIVIHDDCIVNSEDAEKIIKQMGIIYHNYNLKNKSKKEQE